MKQETELRKKLNKIKSSIDRRMGFVDKRIELLSTEDEHDMTKFLVLCNEKNFLRGLAKDFFPDLLLTEEERKENIDKVTAALEVWAKRRKK